MPGLGTSYGRGGATTNQMDVRFADAVLIMGSNMAECHPVSFRFVMQAKLNGAKVLHVDPRFTRTSAMADVYAPLRAGTDIVFLGGLIRYVLEEQKYFKDYVVAYTNAATLITDEYQDTEDLDGLFSGFDPERKEYDPTSWRYDAEPRERPGNQPVRELNDASTFSARGGKLTKPPRTDPTLQDPRCVFQILRRHYARYTPEMVEQVCGTPRETFLKVAETLWRTPRAPTAPRVICYAVGWTQHTTGVQTIRAATILQLLLGNIGRPGGGILALRGHASIQGSTDIPTLYNLLPGYLNTPSALKNHDTLADYIETEISPTSYWVHFPKFIVSLLKAWYGDAATKENDYGFGWLPRNVGDHSHMPMFVAMSEGKIRGFMAMGQNPAVGGQNAGFQRRALAKLDWLVVSDLYETETATFWKDSPEVTLRRGEARGHRHRGLPAPGRRHRRDGRHLHQHPAPDPVARPRRRPARRRPLRPLVHRPPRPPAQAALRRQHARARPADPGPDLELHRPRGERRAGGSRTSPRPRCVLKEMNGYHVATGKPVKGFGDLKADGSTACGAWIYSGVYAPTPDEPDGHNHAANRNGDDWVALGWAFAWPANRRIMYNRAAADPQGNPWPKEARLARQFGNGAKGYVYWDPEAQGPDPADPVEARPRPLGRPRRPRLPRHQAADRRRPSPTAWASTSTTAPRPS